QIALAGFGGSTEGRVADLSTYVPAAPDDPSPTRPDFGRGYFVPQLFLLEEGRSTRRISLPEEPMGNWPPVVAGDRVAAPYRTKPGFRVLLLDWASGKPVLDLVLAGAADVTVRLSKEVLVVADSQGRVLVFETFRGRLIRDLRT